MLTEIQEQQLFDLIDRHFSDRGYIVVWESSWWSEKQGVNRFFRQKGADPFLRVQYQVLAIGADDSISLPLCSYDGKGLPQAGWPFISEADWFVFYIDGITQESNTVSTFNELFAEEDQLIDLRGKNHCCLVIDAREFRHQFGSWLELYPPKKTEKCQQYSYLVSLHIEAIELFHAHSSSFTLEVQP